MKALAEKIKIINNIESFLCAEAGKYGANPSPQEYKSSVAADAGKIIVVQSGSALSFKLPLMR